MTCSMDFLPLGTVIVRVVFARREFALHEDVRALDETGRQLREAIPETICYVESKNLFESRNTTRMFSFFLKPVCFSGDRRCM